MGYLSNFIVYMLAMLGVLMLALFIFRQTTSCNLKRTTKGKGLKVLDTLSLSARKTLYVIEAGRERFLIAGDTDNTTLISKLENNANYRDDFQENTTAAQTQSETGIFSSKKNPYESVIKNLAEKLRG